MHKSSPEPTTVAIYTNPQTYTRNLHKSTQNQQTKEISKPKNFTSTNQANKEISPFLGVAEAQLVGTSCLCRCQRQVSNGAKGKGVLGYVRERERDLYVGWIKKCKIILLCCSTQQHYLVIIAKVKFCWEVANARRTHFYVGMGEVIGRQSYPITFDGRHLPSHQPNF